MDELSRAIDDGVNNYKALSQVCFTLIFELFYIISCFHTSITAF